MSTNFFGETRPTTPYFALITLYSKFPKVVNTPPPFLILLTNDVNLSMKYSFLK